MRRSAGPPSAPYCAIVLAVALPLSLRAAAEVTGIELNVSDLPRAIVFYSEALQFQIGNGTTRERVYASAKSR
ncbi:MAG: hypothetical protein H0X34_12075 [Chthoniobacterales bacterium]|nr:hypothetical protein [Chthoniobacterales bacterium]